VNILEPKQRAHSPLLGAELASKLKTDYIPYGRRFPVRSAAGSFKLPFYSVLPVISNSSTSKKIRTSSDNGDIIPLNICV